MVSIRRIVAVLGGVALAAGTGLAAAPVASADDCPPSPAPATGTASLASVLLAGDVGFDHNGDDFDVLTQAVLTVLKAKPKSPVKVLTDGNVALTAFIPTDRAFSKLVTSVSGKMPGSEQATFDAVAGLGVDTVETVLLYHVVPGATITGAQALKSNGAQLATAQGGKITVSVRWHRIALIDADTNARNPRVVVADINKGNKQIAHAINRVLRPIDLP